jgi:hypothetical protein
MTTEQIDREFWLIILTTWYMDELDKMEDYARAVEVNLGLRS